MSKMSKHERAIRNRIERLDDAINELMAHYNHYKTKLEIARDEQVLLAWAPQRCRGGRIHARRRRRRGAFQSDTRGAFQSDTRGAFQSDTRGGCDMTDEQKRWIDNATLHQLLDKGGLLQSVSRCFRVRSGSTSRR